MGLIYAHTSLINIVGSYEGLTKEEILDLNLKTFKAKIEKYWDRLVPSKGKQLFPLEIEEKNGKYFLSNEVKENNRDCISSWKENIEAMLKNSYNHE